MWGVLRAPHGTNRRHPGSPGQHHRLAADRRLSCLAHVAGDLVVDVPPESQVHRQVVRKGVPVRDFVIDPVVRLFEVEVERPALETPGGDLARLLAPFADPATQAAAATDPAESGTAPQRAAARSARS